MTKSYYFLILYLVYYLQSNGQEQKIMLPIGHTDEVISVAISQDGKWIVSGSRDLTAKVWDIETGWLLAEINSGGDASPYDFSNVTFLNDGKRIVFDQSLFFDIYSGNRCSDCEDSIDYDVSEDCTPESLIAEIKNERKLTTAVFKFIRNNSQNRILISPDKRYLYQLSGYNQNYGDVITGDDYSYVYNKITVWSVKTSKIVYENNQVLVSQHSDLLSSNGKLLVTPERDSTVTVRNAQTGKFLFRLDGLKTIVKDIRFCNNEKTIVTAGFDHTVRLWDLKNGRLLQDFVGHTAKVNSINFSKDGDRLVSGSADKTVKIWDIRDGQLIHDLKGKPTQVSQARFSPDGRRFTVKSMDRFFEFDLATGTYQRTEMESSDEIQFSSKQDLQNSSNGNLISPDSSLLLTYFKTYFQVSSTRETGKVYSLRNNNMESFIDARFSPDSKYILVTTNRNIVKCYCVDSLEIFGKRPDGTDYSLKEKVYNKSTVPFFTFMAFDSTDYFITTPDGYYLSTPDAVKMLHYVTNDLGVISFEQLDVKFNRPDKVLRSIGKSSAPILAMYENAYFKRITRLGFDTSYFQTNYSVPVADIVNRSLVASVVSVNKIEIHIKGYDSTVALNKFNVWVNEVPVFGKQGFNLLQRNAQQIDTILSINLSVGLNRIETLVTNRAGIESFRKPLLINNNSRQTQLEKIYFIGFGIDRYLDSARNLYYSVKDIKDLTKQLQQKFGNQLIVDTFFNQKFSAESIQLVKQKLVNSSVNDKVIVAYSGHGLLSKRFDYFLSTYDVDFNQPDGKGLAYEVLEDLLDNIPARKKLLLIDACHSGEVDKSDIVVTDKSMTVDSVQGISKGGIVINTEDKSAKVGLKNSFSLMQKLFVNVGKNTGAVIISAAEGTESALEKSNLKNGVFTYSILEALCDYSTITISELKKIVGKRVEELTNGRQKPTSRNETIAVNWSIW